MVSLNDYLYDGNTVLKILHQYESDLRAEAKVSHSLVDLAHSNFLLQLTNLLEHNDFLTLQSQRVREFYYHMAREYPNLAFTLKGRIKSLIRAEGKFNGYVIEYISDYYKEHGEVPSLEGLRTRLGFFRDLIAYRIVISLPPCNLLPGQDQETEELKYLYRIANELPRFMEEQGFTAVSAWDNEESSSELLNLKPEVRAFYRDYVANPKSLGYRSLHITFYDNIARCHIEMQLRTKDMDDMATIGPANHLGYEQRQKKERIKRELVPVGASKEFDDAWEREYLLQHLDLSKVKVNMFRAFSADLMNDSCGLYRGRLITPFEHLSKFQRDSE